MKIINENLNYKLKGIILFSSFCFLTAITNNGLASSQQFNSNTNDSLTRLKELLFLAKSDSVKIKHSLEIINHLIIKPTTSRADLNQAQNQLKEALNLSKKIKSSIWEYKTMLMYARYYKKQNLIPQQEIAYRKAILIAQNIGSKLGEANAWRAYYIGVPDTVSDYKNKTFYERAANAHALYKQAGVSFTDKYREASLLKSMADFHLEEEKFDLAIQELFEVIALDKKHKLPDLPMAYDLLSAVYQRKGELSNALNYALLSVKTAQSSKEEVLETYLNRVGAAYEAMGKPNESISWYEKTLNRTNKNDPYRFVTAYNVSNQLVKLGKAEKALSILKSTWNEVIDKTSGHEYFMFLGFGECYTALKKYDLAAKHFNALLNDSNLKYFSNQFRTSVFFAVSEFYFAQNKYQLALQFAEKASENQISMALPRQIRLNEILYKIDIATNRPAEAILRLQTFHKLKDSMLSQENLNNIERLQIEFQASQKENENEILRKKSQLQSQELNRIQLIKNITFVGLAFLSIVLLLLYGRFRLKKKLHNTLIKKKADIDLAYAKLESNVEQKNKLIEEKESLIKEVHHRVKNNLQLTISLLNSQSHYLEDPSAIEAIKESQHRLKSIALIHQKLYQTENVSCINIQPYIFELVDYLKESLTDGRKISFDLDVLKLELDISKAVPLGLIINEAITNIFKYAFLGIDNGKIAISLKEHDSDYYRLIIQDNGIGLPPDFDYKKSNTLGLTLMKGLSSQIDGTFLMQNKNGVCVSLIFQNTSEEHRIDD